MRKLRHERQCMLVTESELRTQVTQLTTLERTSRTETSQARQEVEHLQSKLTTVTQRLQVSALCLFFIYSFILLDSLLLTSK